MSEIVPFALNFCQKYVIILFLGVTTHSLRHFIFQAESPVSSERNTTYLVWRMLAIVSYLHHQHSSFEILFQKREML